ncbi:MAG: 23S rRNA (uracil(747)-C(5))-methyltransferase RlmC [Actinomycetales bacterium]|nr:23S rRNA (uracil(747)-C(5))-methyltransferase RlmC [Actinomycetales bacterium]
MQCDYFDAGVCRSCTLMGTAYQGQLAAKDARCRAALAQTTPPGRLIDWLDPVPSAPSGFRNKAKLVVGATAAAPTLGILDPRGHGVDLRACGLHEPTLYAALPQFAAFVTAAGLTPYDVPARRGELKYLLVTASPTGELMLRIVLRSRDLLDRALEALPRLQAAVPHLAVVSANLHPEHKAVLEGDTELTLSGRASLPMPVNDLVLRLHPRSFFQTNTAIAAALYRQARTWIDETAPASVTDLYCGVGGFALHAAAPGRAVLGVEVSPEAVDSARTTAADQAQTRADLGPVDFVSGDATAYALGHPAAELIVVNPPRRGLDPQLTDWLERTDVGYVVYSSCNVTTLARDLARMPSLRPVRARVFDMFPQSEHLEVMVLLARG